MLLAAASEAAASLGDREWTSLARRQEMFIADHLLAWIEELERDAAANAKIGFYAALIGLVRGVLLWDRQLLIEYVTEGG